ncbi:CAAX prenyl protease-related protein [Geomonas agri]|uniref:CAAX prenyl protease-related protein n=1 Tax=Geomonas agri TaxID=2873702 RepID=UPI001CD40C7B|nr:CAAX prenyl protease-related protein [Geomonas agri]
MSKTAIQARLYREAVCRVLPFAVFMAFVGLQELLQIAERAGWLKLPPTAHLYLYPIKALTVAVLLWAYRKKYRELHLEELCNLTRNVTVVLVGVVTFVLWISIDYAVPFSAAPAGFMPHLLPAGPVRLAITGVRMAGAVLVVPLMEELFWRSFLLRYLVHPAFRSVRIGTFTWPSFLLTTVLFGLEHHLFWAGMAAGAIYNFVCYRTRSITLCVLAHAVTNLALVCYVLATGNWHLW